MTHRRLIVALACAFAAACASAPAEAAAVDARTLLPALQTATPHLTGYSRDLFRLWIDADGNGCDTRDEVLLAEARVRPTVLPGCRLEGGRWWSAYDDAFATSASRLDIDHFVPLSEAWRSGAWRWSAGTRQAYANDLGYSLSLIAVSASTNRSKGDQDPATWLPPFSGYRCRYVATWIAIKWRWRLAVDAVERVALRAGLIGCGSSTRVPQPTRAAVTLGPAGGSSGGGSSGGGASSGSGSSGGLDPRFSSCRAAIAAGYGPYTRGVDEEYDWYRDGDGDGVVCER